MKPARLEFLPARFSVVIWVTATSVALGAALAATVAVRRMQGQAEAIRSEQWDVAQARQNATNQHFNSPPPGAASLAPMTAFQTLHASRWGGCLATIERVDEQGAHLASVTVDLATGMQRIEYRLDSLALVAPVTARLNSEASRAPWTLDSVHSTPRELEMAAPNTPARIRASWVLHLKAGNRRP